MKLDKMTDAKLNTLFKEVSAEVERRKKENSEHAKAEKELAALAKKYGTATIKRLAAITKAKGRGRPAKKRAKVAAIYCNPDNQQETWTGRGRTAKWFKAAEAKHGRDALRIANQGGDQHAGAQEAS
ncbi:MAG: H-NS histone family protein [Gammaproteobacteria bacterium]|jgi:DNA-binding protein H-NS|nr:H-NS histone family protein [Gammaproteobacteria bacterium]MBT7024596.1 H-NS histone family protein [Gammaproteobacteria bacterium]